MRAAVADNYLRWGGESRVVERLQETVDPRLFGSAAARRFFGIRAETEAAGKMVQPALIGTAVCRNEFHRCGDGNSLLQSVDAPDVSK